MLNLTSENQSLLEYIAESQQKMDSNAILESIVKNLEFVICEIPERATKTDLFEALARTVRDKLIWQLNETQQRYEKSEAKQVNYLSLEYLIGRSLRNNLVNLEIYDVCQQVMKRLGVNLIEIEECERDAGLGNGGLGRLAACFLDLWRPCSCQLLDTAFAMSMGFFNKNLRMDNRSNSQMVGWKMVILGKFVDRTSTIRSVFMEGLLMKLTSGEDPSVVG